MTEVKQDTKVVENQVRGQVSSIVNVQRIVANTQNLVNSTDIKGGDAKAVGEIIDWLSSLYNELEKQKIQLSALLPQDAPKTPVKLDVVSPDAKPQTDSETSKTNEPTPSVA